jgi:hypothetical protein
VIARALSIEVTGLALKVCHTHRRRDDAISYWSQAIVAVSGPAAEQRHAGYPADVRARLWQRAYWKGDRANAEHWLRLAAGRATLVQTEAMARHLVGEQWPAIVRVAQALVEEGELDGARIEALMGCERCIGYNLDTRWVGSR